LRHTVALTRLFAPDERDITPPKRFLKPCVAIIGATLSKTSAPVHDAPKVAADPINVMLWVALSIKPIVPVSGCVYSIQT
jgi:hypothetical protein